MNFRPHRSLAALGMTFLLACASSPQQTPAKPITQLPPAALDVMCQRLRAEGMTSEVRVVKETQRIITPASLKALAEASYSAKDVKPEVVQAILLTPLIPIEKPEKTCISRFITSAEAARANDVMLIQFSSPFANPFARNQSGTLARLSLGGEASTWYWIPLIYRNDQWLAGAPAALSVIE